MSKIPVKILGTGAYLPKQRVSSAILEKTLNYPVGTLAKTSSVQTRYYVSEETSTDMGFLAAQEAMSSAQVSAQEIDAIVSVSAVPQQALPTNAALLHQRLNLSPTVMAFDINATCISFLTGLFSMGHMVAKGVFKNVLLVSSDIGSTALNPNDPKTASLFGDGAAACVVGPSTSQAILGAYFETHSHCAQACQCEGGGTLLGVRRDIPLERSYFRMDGPKLFKAAIPPAMKMIKTLSELDDEPIDLYIPHQASPLALDLFQKRLGVKDEQFMHIVRDYGNMVATSIPFTLNKAIKSGRLKRGDRTLLFGTGAGLTVGGLLLEY